MNLQQLRYFQTAAQLKHYTKAASVHHTSQPALSAAVSNLEKELGVKLFEKSGRGVELTFHGRNFLNHVDMALSQLDQGIEEINQYLNQNKNILNLSATFRLGANVLPDILIKFKQAYQNYTIRTSQGAYNRLLELLLSGKTDFLLARLDESIINNKRLDYCILYYEDIYLLTSINNPLAEFDEICLSQLKNESIIIFDESTGFKDTTLSYFKDCDFVPDIAYEATDNHTVASMVEADLGVALVGEMKGISNKTKIIKIKGHEHKSSICIAWNKETVTSGASRTFVRFIKNHYKSPEHRDWNFS